jgi:hypothetical protein
MTGIGASSFLLAGTEIIYSDIFFFTICSIIFIYSDIMLTKNVHCRKWIYIGMLIGLSMLIRTIGIVILGGFVTSFILKRNWKDLFFLFTGFFILQAPWLIWISNNRGGTFNAYNTAFLSSFTNQTILKNINELISHILPSIFIPLLETKQVISFLYRFNMSFITYIPGCFLILAIIIGLFEKLKKLDPSYIGLTYYLIIIMISPWTYQMYRYLIPVIPLIIICLSEFKRAFNKYLFKMSMPVLITIIFLLISNICKQYTPIKNTIQYGFPAGESLRTEWKDYQYICRQLSLLIPKDATVASSFPFSVFIMTNRKTLPISPDSDLENTIKSSTEKDIFILSTPREDIETKKEFGRTRVVEYINRNPRLVSEIWKNKNGALYKITNQD